VAWIFSACGQCEYCRRGDENLCPDFQATGRDANGGYAEYMTVGEDFAYLIPEDFTDAEAAPLLCAGAIGYRSLRLCKLQDGQNLGLTGFGSVGASGPQNGAASISQIENIRLCRSAEERRFARALGATWAGGIEDSAGAHDCAPSGLHAIIDTTRPGNRSWKR